MTTDDAWPSLAVDSWEPTVHTVSMWSRSVGKASWEVVRTATEPDAMVLESTYVVAAELGVWPCASFEVDSARLPQS